MMQQSQQPHVDGSMERTREAGCSVVGGGSHHKAIMAEAEKAAHDRKGVPSPWKSDWERDWQWMLMLHLIPVSVVDRELLASQKVITQRFPRIHCLTMAERHTTTIRKTRRPE